MNRALVIEPNGSVGQQISEMLGKLGITSELAKQPAQAKQKLGKSRWDLVLVDIEMPGLGAFELARKIKREAPDTLIAFLATRPGRPAFDEAFTLGADVFRTKPFQREDFAHRVRTIFNFRGKHGPGVALARHLIPELHDPSSGRLDARRIADCLAVSLSTLAAAIGKKVVTVHKSPAAGALQEHLAPIERSLAILTNLLGAKNHVLAWLNSAHPDLGNRSPLSLILDGKATDVLEMLEGALEGQPS